PGPGGCTELCASARAVHADEGREPTTRFKAKPAERDGTGLPRRRRQDFVHDGTMTRRADHLADRRAAAHEDRFFALLARLPAAPVEEADGVIGIVLFLVEIALGANVVGDAPGDVAGAADHDRRHARQRYTGHVKLTGVEPDFVPDRHRTERYVRVVG